MLKLTVAECLKRDYVRTKFHQNREGQSCFFCADLTLMSILTYSLMLRRQKHGSWSGNFRVIRFKFSRKNISWSRIPTKIFWRFTFPGLVIWNETTHAIRTACMLRSWLPCSCWRTTIACKREPNNAVGTYCGSKDRRFIGHWAKSFRAFAMSSSDMLVSKRPSRAK